MSNDFLNSSKTLFEYYRSLGDKTFAQLSEAQLLQKTDDEANSIAIIVNHLNGNMLSRWTNFLSEDGEKEWRQRDAEFEEKINSRDDLLIKWNQGWDCVFTALDSINEENFNQLVYIRNQGHSILEAVQRQLGHYAYHVGQIVFLGRMIKGDDWTSLSIPKGDSNVFNSKKFEQKKKKGHFTDEFLKDDK